MGRHDFPNKGEMGDFDGILGLLRVLIGVAVVLDASSGPLGRGGGSTMQKRGSVGKFLAAMTCLNVSKALEGNG